MSPTMLPLSPFDIAVPDTPRLMPARHTSRADYRHYFDAYYLHILLTPFEYYALAASPSDCFRHTADTSFSPARA